MRRSEIALSLVLMLVLAPGCSRKGAQAREREEEAEGKAHAGGQAAAQAAAQALDLKEIRGLKFMKVPEARAGSRWMPGEAQGDEASQVVLSSSVKGIVLQLAAAPGQARGKGALLATIQSPELARLKAAWTAARSRMERARLDLEREERLFKAGAGARRELEAARSEAEMAKAEEEAARLGLEAVGLKPGEPGAAFPLRAPVGGSVVAWKVQRGQGVEAGQELGAFQAAQATVVKVELPQPGPAGWAAGSECEVRQAGGRSWKARLEGLPAVLSAENHRLAYRLRFLGGALPIPGSPVEVKVPVDSGVFLPQAALQQMEGQWGVFVVEKDQARFRPVKRGVELKDEVQVLEGLKPGETVVAEGAYLLKSLHLKRTQPEEEE